MILKCASSPPLPQAEMSKCIVITRPPAMYPAADYFTYMRATLRSTPPPSGWPLPKRSAMILVEVSQQVFFYYARFIFVQYVRIVLQCKPDVKLSYVILCWINPCLSLSLSLISLPRFYQITTISVLVLGMFGHCGRWQNVLIKFGPWFYSQCFRKLLSCLTGM